MPLTYENNKLVWNMPKKEQYSNIPKWFIDNLDRYINEGIWCSSHVFTSIFHNDLSMTISYADTHMLKELKNIIILLYNEVPSGCWGSKENVDKWILEKGLIKINNE